jgi:hypothetical protein
VSFCRTCGPPLQCCKHHLQRSSDSDVVGQAGSMAYLGALATLQHISFLSRFRTYGNRRARPSLLQPRTHNALSPPQQHRHHAGTCCPKRLQTDEPLLLPHLLPHCWRAPHAVFHSFDRPGKLERITHDGPGSYQVHLDSPGALQCCVVTVPLRISHCQSQST